MDKPDIVELEPCPFCGGGAKWIDDTGSFDEPFGLVSEHTDRCHLVCFLAEKDEIIRAWSQRADNPEITRLRAQLAAAREGLEVANEAIRDMFRYYDGGETRGSYDGRPERRQLREAGGRVRITLAALKETDNG